MTQPAAPQKTESYAPAIIDADLENNNANGHDMYTQVQIHERSNAITVKHVASEHEANGQTATLGFQSAGGGSAPGFVLTLRRSSGSNGLTSGEPPAMGRQMTAHLVWMDERPLDPRRVYLLAVPQWDGRHAPVARRRFREPGHLPEVLDDPLKQGVLAGALQR